MAVNYRCIRADRAWVFHDPHGPTELGRAYTYDPCAAVGTGTIGRWQDERGAAPTNAVPAPISLFPAPTNPMPAPTSLVPAPIKVVPAWTNGASTHPARRW
ncbi:hypothetical protein BC826DRAFT_1114207 [Russula brevipes]|nr:hypothetical protein BC826DRAFT_1114207 [Russula brevipes]